MKYQVTARKWRPQEFSQVVGQEHVTTALSNAITSGKVPHAYLFSGPRGVGKTSTARILAKSLNCTQSPNICGECSACREITLGQSLDVREIDGASNRGIEQIREIRDNAVYTPISLRYKIFIIDEVHMLTKEASNALLKILEEPPNHVIFMLATTEANKVLPTIRSRCQHYLLKRIPLETIITQLANIVESENYSYERSALEEIAHAGDGSMRDSQTILDQIILYSQGNITIQAVREVLGVPETIYFEKIIQGLIDQDIVSILEQFNTYLMEAGDGISFAENMIKFLRKALLVKKVPVNHMLLDISDDKYKETAMLFSSLSDKDIINLLNLNLDLYDTLRKETAERFWIESTLFKMFDYRNRVSLSELRQEIFKVIGRNNPIVSTEGSSKNNIQPVVSTQGTFGAKLQERNQNQVTAVPQKSTDIQPIEKSLPEKGSFSHENLIEHEPKNAKGQANAESSSMGDTIEDSIRNLFEIP